MARSSGSLLTSSLFLSALMFFFFFFFFFSSSSTVVFAGGDHKLSWIPMRAGGGGGLGGAICGGSVGECMGSSDEFEMGSEISRRILQMQTTNYISYGALQRNTVPCSQRGQSYYNCQPGQAANPYNRGCSAIARCRS